MVRRRPRISVYTRAIDVVSSGDGGGIKRVGPADGINVLDLDVIVRNNNTFMSAGSLLCQQRLVSDPPCFHRGYPLSCTLRVRKTVENKVLCLASGVTICEITIPKS